MSIRTELDKTALYLRNARNAVIGRGGEISATAGFKDLADAITNIPNDQTLAYQKVASSTSRVIVPQNVEPVAILNKIGGMTYKCNQLIPYPFDNTTKTLNGITYTDNGDGTITANGTATADSFFSFFYTWGTFNLSAGNYYFSGCASGGSGSTYRINVAFKNAEGTTMFDKVESGTGLSISLTEPATALYCRLTIGNGTTLNNLVFKPMLNSGTSSLPFEQYFEGLRDSKVTSIVSKGVNLFDISKAVNENFVDNGDGTYTITHNGGGKRFSAKVPLNIPANTTVICKGNKVSGEINASIQFVFEDNTTWDSTVAINGSKYKRTPPKNIVGARFYLNLGTDGKFSTIFDVQIEYGETATEYKPYVGILGITNIPEAVTSREGYGEGVDSTYYNYIVWRNGRCYEVLTCKKLVFNGTENWKHQAGTTSCFQAYSPIQDVALHYNGISNLYKFIKYADLKEQPNFRVGTKGDSIWLDAPLGVFTDISDWKSFLAKCYESGTPITIEYVLAEPIETDITDLMTIDNAIVVEGGGSIKFVNEYDYDMPSETTYIINTAGG